MTKAHGFDAFRRPNGAIGLRNDLLVLSLSGLTSPLARRIGRVLPQAKVITTPHTGGVIGEDAVLRRRMLTGFAIHPNVGAVLLISCQPPEAEAFRRRIADSGRLVEALVLDDNDHDALRLTDAAIRAGARLLKDLSAMRRSPADLSDLLIGVECGRSDTGSGVASNPLVGRVADVVAAAGGRVVAGETMEWFGAEHLLEKRAASPEVARSIRAAVDARMKRAEAVGLNLIGNNPGPVNVEMGLSTLEEKSLGAITKTGTAPIQGVVQHGEAPLGPGLWLMDQPFYSPESISGFVAAGAQLILFTTGSGNSYVSLLAPTIKLSANARACATLIEQIDFDASGVLTGRTSFAEATAALLAQMRDVASGTLTFGEILGEGDEVVSRLGGSL